MYGKLSLVKKMNYADLVGLCGIRPIMQKRKIVRAHNRIIPPSLPDSTGQPEKCFFLVKFSQSDLLMFHCSCFKTN